MSAYTSLLQLTQPSTGEYTGTWGDVINNGITALVEDAIAKMVSFDATSSATWTLSVANGSTDEARCAALRIYGTPAGGVSVVAPAHAKTYIIVNACGKPVTIKTATSTGVTIVAGRNTIVTYNTGSSDFIDLGSSGSGTVTSVAMTVPTFLSVSGSPVTTSGTLAVSLSGTALPIANGGTGSTSTTYCSLSTNVTGTLPVANGGTGVTSSTGSGNVVLSTSPTLVTPILGTPQSGTLSACTVDGNNGVGYINVPQNSQSINYTCVLSDAGKHIFHPSTDTIARTYTIPANSAVPYPIGTVLVFINMTAQVVSIVITTDTLYLAGSGSSGTRSLAQYGSATAIKITSTSWIISGPGLS
jgi:hypothetical protein